MSGVRCGSSRNDRRERRWRHLDTCQYQTILVAEVPRVECAEHGVKTIWVPWAEPGSPFTALYEALVIDWLRAANTKAVARMLGLTWDQVDGVMQRAVRRQLAVQRQVGADETSFQNRHEYVTVVADSEHRVVQHVADRRGKEALAAYYAAFSEQELASIKSAAMDMWEPYTHATLEAVPEAASKIAFDKFHVAMHSGAAVDRVRRQENRALKELAMETWESRDRETALEIFKAWYSWAIRSRLDPIKRVARMIKRHLTGILNAIAFGITNARIEDLNTRIQWLKRSARGFRNRERFRTAIYIHLGGLDLYPASLTHSNS